MLQVVVWNLAVNGRISCNVDWFEPSNQTILMRGMLPFSWQCSVLFEDYITKYSQYLPGTMLFLTKKTPYLSFAEF